MHNDQFSLTNVAAGTYSFPLLGGYYQLAAHATWSSGSLILNEVLPDGSSVFQLFGQASVAAPATNVNKLSADGVLYFYLPPGEYQLVFATGSALYAAITRIPLD